MGKNYSSNEFEFSENDSAFADGIIKKELTEKQGIDLYHDILWIDDRLGYDAENNAWK